MPVVLDHYALRTWPGLHHGAIRLYGHLHGSLRGVGRSVDVGVDVWDFTPVTLAEIRPTLDRQQAMLDDARAARDVSEMDDETEANTRRIQVDPLG